MRTTSNLYTVAERLLPLVEGIEMERVNSGFRIEVMADEFGPAFKNKKQAVAMLSELAVLQGRDPDEIREAAKYEGKVPSESGLSGWEWSALLRILPPKVARQFQAGS